MNDHQSRTRNRTLVQNVADALGVPIEALSASGHPESQLDQTAELLRLWLKIQSPEKRRDLLFKVRQIADGD